MEDFLGVPFSSRVLYVQTDPLPAPSNISRIFSPGSLFSVHSLLCSLIKFFPDHP